MVATVSVFFYIENKKTAPPSIQRGKYYKTEETTKFTFFFGPISKGLALAQGITFLAGPGNWHASAILGLINIAIPF